MCNNSEGTVFGIDLGTTYSCIAYIDDTGNPQVAENMDGGRTTPSVVYFDSADSNLVVVGQAAKDSAVLEPTRTVQFVKQLMGNSKVAIEIDGVDKTPQEISNYILRKVAQDARETTGFDVKNVVITVPAYFGDKEREATAAAGRMADLNVLGIVQEPVAAAVYYGCNKSETDQTVLVYDLGGGTFDVTVMNISDNGSSIQVICSDGNHNLGGRLWDAQLVNYLAEVFRDENDFEDDFDEFALQTFQDAAEKYKKQLSSRKEVRVVLDIAGLKLHTKLTRDIFESRTAALLDETIRLTAKTIENARSKGYEVSKILLVGGSSYMPQVQNALDSNFPDIPKELNEPNEAVAKGAAIVSRDKAIMHNQMIIDGNGEEKEKLGGGDNKTGDEKDEDDVIISLPYGIDVESIKPTKIRLATTKSYGIQVVVRKGDTSQDMIQNMIIKNQVMPDEGAYTREQRFGTQADGQTSVDIKIYENDEEAELIEIGDLVPIKEASFDLGGPKPAGTPIDVTFSLDSEGILDILAIEPASGLQCPVRIETGGLTREEIEEIKKGIIVNVE